VVREAVRMGAVRVGDTVRMTVPELTDIPLESVIEALTEKVPEALGRQFRDEALTLAQPEGRPDQAKMDQPPVPLVAPKESTVLCPRSRFMEVPVGVVTVGSAETINVCAVVADPPFVSLIHTWTPKVPGTEGEHDKLAALPPTHPLGSPFQE
jgi:hypothetical protein